ncbi:MAG: Smr/MutS family protein [Syntrophomonadaceae bacterium]
MERYSNVKIETVDLHGLSVEEALEKTRINLKWCLEHGVDVLDINHGKGFHSIRNFSVIKQEVRKMLKNEASIREAGYKVIYGEYNLPITLSYDEGHTLVVAKDAINSYIGGAKQQAKNWAIFSTSGRKQRKAQKNFNSSKRKKLR